MVPSFSFCVPFPFYSSSSLSPFSFHATPQESLWYFLFPRIQFAFLFWSLDFHFPFHFYSIPRRRKIHCFTKGFHCFPSCHLLHFYVCSLFAFVWKGKIWISNTHFRADNLMGAHSAVALSSAEGNFPDSEWSIPFNSFPFINNYLAGVHGKWSLAGIFILPSSRCWTRYTVSDLWIPPAPGS